jgi:hypothetical protein
VRTDSIPRDQWLEALKAAEAKASEGDPGLTGPELAEVMGLGIHAARRRIASAIKAGELVVGKAPRSRMDGVRQWVTVYVLAGRKL